MATRTPAAPARNIPWKQVFDVLSTQKNVGNLAKLSGASKNARHASESIKDGLANLALRTSSVITDDVSPLTSKQFEVLAKFHRIAAEALQRIRAFPMLGIAFEDVAHLMAFMMAECRTSGLQHMSSDGAYDSHRLPILPLLTGLPTAWSDWNAVSPRDIVDYVRTFYDARGMKGKHPAHYETKFLLGLKVLSMKLARQPGPLPAGAPEFAQAISLGYLRRVAEHGYNLEDLKHILARGYVYDDLAHSAKEACGLAHKVCLEVFTTRPSTGKMDLAAAAMRSKDPSLRKAGVAMKEAKPSEKLVQEARRKLSAAMAEGLGVKAKANDEFDILRVVYLACAFVYSAYVLPERFAELAALDKYPDSRPDSETAFDGIRNWMSQRYFNQHYTDVARGLFATFDFKSSWRNLKDRALKLANAILASAHDLHIYAGIFDSLRPMIFNGPEAPMKFFRNNKWTYTEDAWHKRPDTIKYMYAQDLKDVTKLFFCVLEDISKRVGSKIASPFKEGDWPATRTSYEPRPSKLTAYMTLDKHIQRYQTEKK